MPSPVSFSLTLAPLPVNFDGTPQQLATAIIERLTVAPVEPWNSFQISDSLPGSNVGPVLFEGVEWKVFDEGLGNYTVLRVDGAGIKPGTIELAALKSVPGNAQAIYKWDGSGDPSSIAPGTEGQVLKMVSGVPTWVTVTDRPNYAFRVSKSASPQTVIAGAGFTQVVFDAVDFGGDNFASNVFTAPEAGKYLFKASVQSSLNSGTGTGADRVLAIRKNGNIISWDKLPLGEVNGASSRVVEILDLAEGDTVDIAFSVATTGSSDWALPATSADCNFSGHRIN